MLKKEILDTLKILGQSMLILVIIPMVILMDWHIFHSQWEISGILEPVFVAIVILFAAYSGVSIFQREKKDRAMEYLLSLPMSKWKILVSKIFPRLFFLLLLITAGGMLSISRNIIIDGMSLLVLFFMAMFISLAVDSVINAMLGVLLLNIILYYSSLVLSYVTMEYNLLGIGLPVAWLSQLLPGLFLIIPLAAAFGLTLKNFDIKPLKWQAKPYLFIALPCISLLLLFLMVFIKDYIIWIRKIG